LRYISTRNIPKGGQAPPKDFEEVLLTGLAPDGGLYLPEAWPKLDPAEIATWRDRPYQEIACRIMAPFVGGCLAPEELRALIDGAYRAFDDPRIAPMRELEPGFYLLELFHGPTLAFKDVALQLLGHLFDHFLKRRQMRLTIIGATSGDTGAAAIAALRGRAMIDVFILHPKGRVSDTQRRMMTTVAERNVRNIAIAGTFDDCQALAKAAFADAELNARYHLGAINSINWARIMAQIVYYVTAWIFACPTGGRCAFAVPSGNFGDAYAGYAASRMGLPVAKIIVASNRNDILARFFRTGEYRRGEVRATLSPAMDIQLASNFERLLFDLVGRDGAKVRALMASLERDKGFRLETKEPGDAFALFAGERVDDEQTLAMIRSCHRDWGIIIDPHTAVGLVAASRQRKAIASPIAALATAHPAKFAPTIINALGFAPPLPPHLGDLKAKEEHFVTLPRDFPALANYIKSALEP
jgi:threonine synthase